MTAQTFRFLAKYRLKNSADFKRVFERRCSASDEKILIYVRKNELDHARIGLSVSRKVGGAVERNRWKRLLREAFRLNAAKLPSGIDVVIVPRPDFQPELLALQTSLVHLSKRAATKLDKS